MSDWPKKTKDLFTKNLVWKFLSLLIAVMLWFMVINVRNPVDIRTFGRALQIEGISAIEAGNYILTNEEALSARGISVRVRASVQALQDLNRGKEDLRAYIDLKPIDISRTEELGKPMSVNVKVDLPAYLDGTQYEIIGWSPATVDIVLDKLVEETFPVTPVVDRGAPEGYVSLQAAAEPAFVTVGGAKSVIDTIDTVRAVLDLSGATEDVSETVKLQVQDRSGNDITNLVALSANEAVVRASVKKYGQIPIAAPTLTGNPAPGYRFESATINMDAVEVVGRAEDIAAMTALQLPTINIDNLNATETVTFDLREFLKDTGLSVKSGAPYEAQVTVGIGREITRELSIPVESLSIEGMDRYFVLPDGFVRFTVRGDEKTVAAIAAGALPASIDLIGLEAGWATVPVNVQLPDGVILVGDRPTIVVEILEEAPPPSDMPEETTAADETPATNETDETGEAQGTENTEVGPKTNPLPGSPMW